MKKNNEKNTILVDGRWKGNYGIGRFSAEILKRLKKIDVLEEGPHPLSIKNFMWQAKTLHKKYRHYRIFFTPGFNPVFHKKLPYVLTICDLIYLHTKGWKGTLKKIFFELVIKSSVKKAKKIITISDYSKRTLLEWTNISEEKIINVGCGISDIFHPQGLKFSPGYPYLLHVGNNKSHKNLERLLIAFSKSNIDPSIKLLFTCHATPKLAQLIKLHNISHRIIFLNNLSEEELANCYRGALALTFPSLYEGFGLPILEAMACGIPVLTSNLTSCPEVAGDAALIVNAEDIFSIKEGIEQLVNNVDLRENLIAKGLQRVACYSWDKAAAMVQEVLNEGCLTD